MTKKAWLSLLVLLVLASAFRFYNLAGRMPFGWDQERDIFAVTEMITTHRPKLIGPVVRGEGGFLLGPLYYYFLFPLVFLTQSHPLSLGVTSILIDLVTLTYLFWIVRHYLSFRTALLTGLIWATSPFLASLSLTSWNVSLVPLYLLLVTHASLVLLDSSSNSNIKTKAATLLAFLFGLVFHIHASLFLLIPTLILFFFRRSFFHYLSWWRFALLAGLPLLPLVLFDLRHQFINLHLFLKFISSSSSSLTASWLVVAKTLLFKYLLYLLHLLLPLNSLLFASALTLFSLVYLWFHRRQPLFSLTLFYLLYTLILLFLYRNPDFPEYYFNLLLPSLTWLLASLFTALLPRFLYPLVLLFYLGLSLRLADFATQPYSLKAKQLVVQRLLEFSPRLDVRYELSPGRSVGFRYLTQYYRLTIDDTSPYKLILRDDNQISSVSGAKQVFSQFIYGYHLLGFVVE